ncbi:MAG: CPBP family intramembrane metalloprotease [Chloroflexi bacterium]|nr:CPBP family intramembrane metalloprotease [Chloroflexota bacterium]
MSHHLSIREDQPGDGDERKVSATGTWKVFGVLMLGALVGAVGILPYALALTGPSAVTITPLLLAASVAQTLIITAIATSVGLNLGERIGLGAPLLHALLAREKKAKGQLLALLLPSIVIGLITGAVIILLDVVVFSSQLFTAVQELSSQQPEAWKGFLASFYGGIVEELLMRLGLMTTLVWLGTKLTRRDRPGAAVVWSSIILVSVLFGVAHLPATAAIVQITWLIVVRAIVLNGVAGIVFGWLYWRRGLLSAVIAHFSADIVLHVLPPLFLMMV